MFRVYLSSLDPLHPLISANVVTHQSQTPPVQCGGLCLCVCVCVPVSGASDLHASVAVAESFCSLREYLEPDMAVYKPI